jgi:hypothetical protein
MIGPRSLAGGLWGLAPAQLAGGDGPLRPVLLAHDRARFDKVPGLQVSVWARERDTANMKVQSWLILGLGLALGAAGCDDEKHGDAQGDVDGGVGPEDLSDEIKALQDEINKLGMGQGALGGRLDVLEKPVDPKSCSAGELCIPDGINLSKVGMQQVITALCSHEATCCTPGELSYLYGPAIKSAAECEAAFTDIVNNGISYSDNSLSPYLDKVIRVAHALNDTRVGVTLNADGVTACAAQITQKACPGGEEETSGCQPSVEDACSLRSLLKGFEREGDTCDPWSGIDECGAGLTCREVEDSDSAQSGICAAKAAVGERCTDDDDCDDLFCNFATGQCQARAKLGEVCAYVDPTFEHAGPYDGEGVGNGVSTTLDCEHGLSCNPLTNTCVKNYCAAGAFCNQNSQCPTGTVCTRSGNEALEQVRYPSYPYSFAGVCGTPVADGGACENIPYWGGNDCASGTCGASVCLKSVGAVCAAPADCASNHCGTDGKCSALCDGDDSDCAAGSYCSNYYYACEPLIAQGIACGSAAPSVAGRNAACQTGYCDGVNCAPKVGPGATCTAGHHAQCPTGQFCKGTTCTAQPAIGTACTTEDACGPGGTQCYDIDGPLSGVESRCYDFYDLPVGIYCSSDGQCASGWCRNTGTTSVCTAGRAAGEACDISGSATRALCGDGLMCATTSNEVSTGTCKKIGLTGDSCDPRHDGRDCLGGDCRLEKERFLCAFNSVSEDRTTYCTNYYY